MERDNLSLVWGAAVNYPREETIHALFERQVSQSPGSPALLHADGAVSYAELNAQANQIAHRLMKHGTQRGDLVGVLMERSVDFVATVLAVLKAGAAYVPLSPDDPAARIVQTIEDAGLELIVSHRGLVDRRAPASFIDLDSDPSSLRNESSLDPSVPGSPTDLAYVMYTSGSTGRPDGVEVAHRGVVRLVLGQQYVPFHEDGIFLLFAPTGFDASTFEIWGALLNGAKLAVMRKPLPTKAVFDRYSVSHLFLTTSLFNVLIDRHPQALGDVAHVIVGGEALSVPHVGRALDALPRTRLLNGYGPTEATTFTSMYAIPPNLDRGRSSVPLGGPIANTHVAVLDDDGRLVPRETPGELVIGGDGVARGYLHRPEKTAERFIADPFGREADAQLYRSGDRAVCRRDGTIDFLGRLDDQIKIRGHRVEPGEIEAVLRELLDVRQCAVVAPGETHRRRLVAFVVYDADRPTEADTLHTRVAARLPTFMVPDRFVAVETLPVTGNGKIDRSALLARAETGQPLGK